MVKVSVTGGAVATYPLTFNAIKNVPGLYQHRNGDVLHVFTKYSVFTKDENMKTGYTRAGHCLYDASKGMQPRKTANDKGPDGKSDWRKYEGKITLSN